MKKILEELQQSGVIKLDLSKKIIKVSNFSTKDSHQNRYRGNNQHKMNSRSKSTDMRPKIKFSDADQDVAIISQKYSLPKEFSYLIKQEIKNRYWEENQHCETYREDLTNHFVITIDGADSKDLDDAVSISKSFFGKWTLGVHIADVSFYVFKNSGLDKEALSRANSYYLIDTVIPMLPKELSNDLCSLNPHEHKKTMTIFIDFDSKGNIIDYRIVPSVIKSSYRMTYDRVEEIIQGSPEKDSKLRKTIKKMDKLFRVLNKKRMQDGSVEFNFKEKKIKLDSLGNPVKIYQKDRLDSERLIEEFMLAANQAAGDFLTKKGLGLFRVHDVPPAEKYINLRKFAAKRGVALPEVPKPQDIQNFITSLANSSVQMSGEILALRSMAQASYQRENIGHFGLGFQKYAHFTSPIRRYADLIVHRLIKYFLFTPNEVPIYTTESLDRIATHISSQERVALEAERDLAKIKSVRYMSSCVGEVFDGIVSSVTSFGIFIEMKYTGIEALIRYSEIDDFMVFDEEQLIARNKSGSKIYALGSPIKICITKVDVERGFIDAVEFIEK